MKIGRRMRVEGPKLRLRFGFDVYEAAHPGEGAALVQAQSLVLDGTTERVEVLDIEADDVLFTVRREGKDVVTYAR